MSGAATKKLLLLFLLIAAGGGCAKKQQPSSVAVAAESPKKKPEKSAEEKTRAAQSSKEFPLYGLVTGLQPPVRQQPGPEFPPLGWLRIGSLVRLAPSPVKTPTCASGWYRINPEGWVCAGEGVQVSDAPPPASPEVESTQTDPGLPYAYYLVKEPLVAAYHRLPCRDDQRAAEAFAQRYTEIKNKDEAEAARLLKGELLGEPVKPPIVAKYLERGFFIAGIDVEVRASRRFVHTVRGQYAKLSQLEERHGSDFHGLELGGQNKLPVAWAVRAAQPFWMKMFANGSLKALTDESSPPIERLTLLPWIKRERINNDVYHRLEGGRFLKNWYAAVAERIDPPTGVKEDEPWVHVSISQQTLVVYRGAEPIYATLVSSGLEGHDTPLGLFNIREKYVADTMSDLGPDAGDARYKIEDVPWTQYFTGSVALHGAFWHAGFGLRRSHGCINLSPLDARWVFAHTRPLLPDGWHGISTEAGGAAGSKVLVTK